MTASLLAISLGLLVGLALGALGGGGSTLAVPILVFVAGLDTQAATTASLIVVGIAAAIGVVRHYRNGNVRLGAGLAFGAAGIAGSAIGTQLNQSLPERLLLLSFSALIVFVAVRMYRSVQSPGAGDTSDTEFVSRMTTTEGSADSSILITDKPRTQRLLTGPAIAKLGAAATAVGVLTGLFGVGGGFAVVPALMLLLGFRTKEAVGTSLVVIAINAAVALSFRAGDVTVDWALVAPFLGTVTLGVLVGSQVSDRIEADRLTRSFAIMLGLVAAYTAANALLL